MSISVDQFSELINKVRFHENKSIELQATTVDVPVGFSILSEIYELLNIITIENAHIHFGCSNDSDLMCVTSPEELWIALFHLAEKKCLPKLN